MNHPAADQDRNSPVLKAFAVLQAIVAARRPIALSEVAGSLGLPKPTAHRMAILLEREGLLQREPGSRRFVIGHGLVDFALEIMAASVVRGSSHAILQGLSQQIGETVNFGTVVLNEVVYLDRVEAAWPLGLKFQPGSRVPIHCTAMGKLFLSRMPKAARDKILRAEPLPRVSPNTIVDPARLEAELETIRRDGVATDNEEFLVGVCCIALPVMDAHKRLRAAIAVSAPVARLDVVRLRRLLPLIEDAARRLAVDLYGAAGAVPLSSLEAALS
ncbi:MAG: IclR family transcriptional regulator [Alphaproteobacteria bacterium]|nr:IclR family transcriptional regulator [Alphaproteobacteria bacterium]